MDSKELEQRSLYHFFDLHLCLNLLSFSLVLEGINFVSMTDGFCFANSLLNMCRFDASDDTVFLDCASRLHKLGRDVGFDVMSRICRGMGIHLR